MEASGPRLQPRGLGKQEQRSGPQTKPHWGSKGTLQKQSRILQGEREAPLGKAGDLDRESPGNRNVNHDEENRTHLGNGEGPLGVERGLGVHPLSQVQKRPMGAELVSP